MRIQGISKEELKGLMEETIINVLTKRKDLLEDAVTEAILDMKLALAIEKGDKKEYVPEEKIIESFLSLIPPVSDQKMKEINKTYGNPERKKKATYSEEIEI